MFFGALAILALIIGRLWGKAGNSFVEGAKTQPEKRQAFILVSAIVLKFLRVSGQNTAFTQDPVDPFDTKGPSSPSLSELSRARFT
jgi:hypothetical protein